MRLSGVKAKAFLKSPDPEVQIFLLFGADAMRVALQRQNLTKLLVGDQAEEEMRLDRLSASDVRKEPSILLDGLKAQGFFPGDRLVILEDANENSLKAVEAAIQERAPQDAKLMITAGSLNARSKLRKLIEATSNAVAIGFYDDPPTPQEILDLAASKGLKDMLPNAKTDIVALGQALEPGDLAQFMEKLALYKHGDPEALDSDDIAAMAPNSLEAALDTAFYNMAEGDADGLGMTLARLFGQGHNPTTLVIGAQRYFRQLYFAACDPAGADQALSRARPPVFGPRKDRMLRHIRGLGPAVIEKILALLLQTDHDLRSTNNRPDQAFAERAFIRIAMLSARRMRR